MSSDMETWLAKDLQICKYPKALDVWIDSLKASNSLIEYPTVWLSVCGSIQSKLDNLQMRFSYWRASQQTCWVFSREHGHQDKGWECLDFPAVAAWKKNPINLAAKNQPQLPKKRGYFPMFSGWIDLSGVLISSSLILFAFLGICLSDWRDVEMPLVVLWVASRYYTPEN